MKLLTKTLEKQFMQQKHDGDPKETKVIAKFFNPCGGQTWYATEYDPEERVFFGFVSLFGDWSDELGYFSLDELQALKVPPFGLGIERDIHFGDHTLQEIMDGKRP